MDQGKDCGSAADSQRQRKHGRDGKDRRQPELTQHITKIAEEFLHGRPLPLLANTLKAAKGSRIVSVFAIVFAGWDEMPADVIYHGYSNLLYMVTLRDIQNARALLQNVAVRTPLVLCKLPEDRQIFIKPENLQPVGSFKLRGAYNKISSLSAEERKRGVVAHSSGNHAQGVAFAARALGVKATIVMPNTGAQGEAGRNAWDGRGSCAGGAGE